jgi:hypothetical protein
MMRRNMFVFFVSLVFFFAFLRHDAQAAVIVQRTLFIGLEKGLLAWWTFDGKDVSGVQAYDRSGNGNRGILTSGPVRAGGKLGQALSFDGVDDYVDVGDPALLKFTSEDFSFGGWIYHMGTFAASENPIGKGNSSAFTPYSFWVNNGVLKILIGASGCGSWLTTADVSSTVTNSTWEHYFLVKSGTNPTLFKNGIAVDSFTMSSATICDSTVVFSRGSGFDVVIRGPWNGFVDDVRIYNRVLFADGVKRLYNMGR